MWQLKKAYYRAFQKVMKIALYAFDWSEPELLEGPGAIKELPEFIKSKGINSVLIVTDKGLMNLHMLDSLFEKLDEAGVDYVVYDGTEPNPKINNIEDARQLYLDNGCEGIIAFGGGSSMDCAKAAGARVTNPNKSVRNGKRSHRRRRRHRSGDAREKRDQRPEAAPEVCRA